MTRIVDIITNAINAMLWRVRSFIVGRQGGGLGYRIHPMPETRPLGPAVALVEV